MKAKLKIPYYEPNKDILYGEGIILYKGNDLYYFEKNNYLPAKFVEKNNAIFEIIEDKPKYLRIVKASADVGWYKKYIGKIFKVYKNTNNANYPDDYYVYYDGTKNRYIIDSKDCEVITRAQYIDYLKEKQIKLTKLINKLENNENNSVS